MTVQLEGASAAARAGDFTNRKPHLEGVFASTAVTPPTALTRESLAEPMPPAAGIDEPLSHRLFPIDSTTGGAVEFNTGIATATVIEPAISTYEPPGPTPPGVVILRPQEQPDHPGPFSRSGVQDVGASSTASVHVIERRILEHPDDIRATARNYAQAFKAYGDELRRINDRSKQCDEFIDFLDQMAAGLADLADALDRAFATTTPEPVLTKEAAEKARQLCLKLLAWRAKIGTEAIDVPGIRVGLFLGGALFLQLLGIDNGAAFAALSGAVVGFPSKPPKE